MGLTLKPYYMPVGISVGVLCWFVDPQGRAAYWWQTQVQMAEIHTQWPILSRSVEVAFLAAHWWWVRSCSCLVTAQEILPMRFTCLVIGWLLYQILWCGTCWSLHGHWWTVLNQTLYLYFNWWKVLWIWIVIGGDNSMTGCLLVGGCLYLNVHWWKILNQVIHQHGYWCRVLCMWFVISLENSWLLVETTL